MRQQAKQTLKNLFHHKSKHTEDATDTPQVPETMQPLPKVLPRNGLA